jgi:GAF domain-containing protein
MSSVSDQSVPSSTITGSEAVELVLERVVDSTMEQIVSLVCEAIDGCSMAGITLLDTSGPHTLAATSEDARRVDQYQYEVSSGPCLDAYRDRVVHRVDSTDSDTRWPEFCRLARAEGVRSVLSLPLLVRQDGLGALNLYADTESAFGPTEERIGLAFAAHASITLSHAQGFWRQEQARQNLEVALTTRGVIDQAKGVLMARTGRSADEAFESLRRASQRTNRKVFDLAQEIIESAQRASPPLTE